MNNIKFDWNDISIVPAPISQIKSRTEINPYYDHRLPIFISPMDTVLDKDNIHIFLELGYEVCVPRGIYNKYNNAFTSFGLDEIEKIISNNDKLPNRLLIDIANGHSIRLMNIARKIKTNYPDVQLMVGNIAHPLTYKEYAEIGVDYIRVGIGGGSACTSSANAAIHYPYGSLIAECAKIKEENGFDTKIVADGGFKNYRDIITALGVGADYVMIGGIANKSLESCGEFYLKDEHSNIYFEIDKKIAINKFNLNENVYKQYRGMSTKAVQKSWGKEKLTTSEGITFYNKVEYKMSTWTENFLDYLKSAMSYCNRKDLKDFVGGVEYVFMTQNAHQRFNK